MKDFYEIIKDLNIDTDSIYKIRMKNNYTLIGEIVEDVNNVLVIGNPIQIFETIVSNDEEYRYDLVEFDNSPYFDEPVISIDKSNISLMVDIGDHDDMIEEYVYHVEELYYMNDLYIEVPERTVAIEEATTNVVVIDFNQWKLDNNRFN